MLSQKRPHLVILLLLAAPALQACREMPHPAAPPEPVSAQVRTLALESVPVEIESPGTVQARNRVMLAAQINGFVREVRVREGDTVRRGQALVTLDSRDAQSRKAAALAALDEAKAALAEAGQAQQASEKTLDAARSQAELAEATLRRYEKLFESRSASPQELDEVRARRDAALSDVSAREAMRAAALDRIRQVEARIAQADAQVRRTEVVLGWTAVDAPVNGRVVARRADPGSAVFPGSPLLEIETTGDLQVLSSIPTQHRGLLSPGLTVTIRPGGDPSAAVQGKIAEIVPTSDPGSHSTAFRVDLPAGFGAPPGAFVAVDVPAGSRQALLVPKDAVRETGQLSGIFVLDSTAHARFRLVKVAPRGDDSLELLSGADPGDRVVLSPPLAVVDGTPVEIRP